MLATFLHSPDKETPPDDPPPIAAVQEELSSPKTSSDPPIPNVANSAVSSDNVAEPSPVSAEELAELSDQAAAGNVDAQRKLGELYFNGKGVSANYDIAIRFFRQAAEKSDSLSLYYLGRCNEFGFGLPKDSDLARTYYTRAVKQGSREARTALRRLNEEVP